MTRRRSRFRLPALVLCFALLCAPRAARADAGTPLMWAGFLHLFVLNALIGVLEAFVLSRLFRLPRSRTISFLVPANYFSMIVGWCLLYVSWTPLEHLLPGQAPLFKAPVLLGMLLVFSWLLSVFLEWPFCAGAMRRTHKGWRPSLRASVIAQTASYALLVPFYWLVSPITLYHNVSIERTLDFVKPPVATVFYINPQDGCVWRIRTDGTANSKVLDAHIHDPNRRLFVRENETNGLCDLWTAWRPPDDFGNAKTAPLRPGVGSGCAESPLGQGSGERETWFNFARPADLRPEARQVWNVWMGFWAGEGVAVRRGDAPQYHFAFETPFEGWICRNATVLPTDQVVFQLGWGASSQIVILDMPARKLGFLAMGQGPAVVLNAR